MNKETGNHRNKISPLTFNRRTGIKEGKRQKMPIIEDIEIKEIQTGLSEEARIISNQKKEQQAVLSYTEKDTMTAVLVEHGSVIRAELTKPTLKKEINKGTEASLGKAKTDKVAKTAKVIQTSPLPKPMKEEFIEHHADSEPSNFKVVDSQNIGAGIKARLAQLRKSHRSTPKKGG